VELVAVSKTHPVAAIVEAYEAGQRVFGENRPQEMAAKQAELAGSSAGAAAAAVAAAGAAGLAGMGAADVAGAAGLFGDIRWHQIGHLQTNKVRLIAPFVSMIHSGDSARLLREISARAVLLGRVIDVLLEIRIAREESKEGWAWSELTEWLSTGEYRTLAGVRFRGVMGVATFTSDTDVVRDEFLRLAGYHAELRERFFGADFDVVSMGMSDDYLLAIECGATMVRIGSAIFGAREYK
jgi:pyridoxal phosphate enzyme (YggS family)